jgi:hypothetical protein
LWDFLLGISGFIHNLFQSWIAEDTILDTSQVRNIIVIDRIDIRCAGKVWRMERQVDHAFLWRYSCGTSCLESVVLLMLRPPYLQTIYASICAAICPRSLSANSLINSKAGKRGGWKGRWIMHSFGGIVVGLLAWNQWFY